MFVDLRPLKNNKQYRFLFLGQTISFFGSMMTYVAIPYQIYSLTKSSFLVGLLGTIQLLPLILSGLVGGSLADNMERRKILLGAELLLTVTTGVLLLNSILQEPSVTLLFIAAAFSSVFVGFHRPAMESITPQLVEKSELAAVAALGSLRYSIGAVAAPALGGWIITQFGIPATYLIDTMTYFISLVFLWMMKPVTAPISTDKVGWESIKNGFSYAITQPVILGTYIVDIVAMTFAMPMALYPAMAESWGGASAAGWLYAAIPLGSILISIFSGAFGEFSRHGFGVTLSALFWGIFIIALAFAPNLYFAVAMLALAGAADAISAIYRQTIWNEVIPNNFRGRLAGLNMLSYMIGPLIGNARAGFVASVSSNYFSILSGGILCTIGCASLIWWLPQFWSYRSTASHSTRNH